MALIDRLDRDESTTGSIRSRTAGIFKVFDCEGARYLSIATTGSEERASAGSRNQNMQFNEASARALLRAIVEAFPSLRAEV